MTRTEIWLTRFAIVGTVAGVLAAGLLWLVVAHPIAVAQALGGIR
jgi:putative flippase GtrA